MADAGGQFILVKKADGTFERRSLDEIKKMKAGATSTPVQVAQPVTAIAVAPVISATITKTPEVPKAIERTAAPAVKPAAMVKPMTKDDSKSLLEEGLPKSTTSAPLISVPRDAQADEIIKKVSFTVASSALNRLRTLIQLRIKDIRSTEQTKETLLRAEKDGGVGLTSEQAREILNLLPNEEMLIPHEDYLPSTTSPLNSFRSAPTAKPEPVKIVPSAPMSAPVNVPAPKPMITPFKPMMPAQPMKPAAPAPTPADKQKVIDTFVKNNPEESFFKLAADLKPKPMMQDIVTKNTPMGPTDEIRFFTLTDFRRLSGNPEEAAMRFKQKFVNLRDESILLYLDAVSGWKNSPLYIEYVTTATAALSKKMRLGSESDLKKISIPEMKAIINMERQLDYL